VAQGKKRRREGRGKSHACEEYKKEGRVLHRRGITGLSGGAKKVGVWVKEGGSFKRTWCTEESIDVSCLGGGGCTQAQVVHKNTKRGKGRRNAWVGEGADEYKIKRGEGRWYGGGEIPQAIINLRGEWEEKNFQKHV